MRSFPGFVALACIWNSIGAFPTAKDVVPTPTVISSGCSWCTPGPWKTDAACATGEWYAVASSILNPPPPVVLNATSFCSEFLRPLVTALSIVNATGATTISTITAYSLVMFTPTTTSTMNMPMSTTSATNPKSTTPAPTKPPSANLVGVELEKKDFTVPEYLTAWYFYGRLDPGCSCIITSAGASIVISETTTMTSYKVTKSTTVTETYTIYP